MHDQAHYWSRSAAVYEAEFIDPYLPTVRNPLRQALAELPDTATQTVADLGCGIGPLLPFLAERFQRVIAVDFAEGMLQRARTACTTLTNVEFLQHRFVDLQSLNGVVDVAVAVNSLVLPDVGELEKSLTAIHDLLKPGGHFLGIVPSIDGVHYFTMLLLDRARRVGMPENKARQNAAHHAEHKHHDFAFGDFRYQHLHQHFWQPFEVPYRLQRAGFSNIELAKVHLAWEQFGCGAELRDEAPPWDWFFHAQRK